jgi:gliding motility-associated-like protein
MKYVFLILSILFCFAASAQNVLDNKVYRVTGYQKGHNNIMSVSNYAEVVPHPRLYIPNAFTPNGDGINDFFGVNGEGLQNFHIIIFNRWGEVIFDATNPHALWDGTFKGKPVEEGVYTYEVLAKNLEGPRTGSVSVLR